MIMNAALTISVLLLAATISCSKSSFVVLNNDRSVPNAELLPTGIYQCERKKAVNQDILGCFVAKGLFCLELLEEAPVDDEDDLFYRAWLKGKKPSYAAIEKINEDSNLDDLALFDLMQGNGVDDGAGTICNVCYERCWNSEKDTPRYLARKYRRVKNGQQQFRET